MEKDISFDILSDLIIHMKYARYLPNKKRRETWGEIVTRNKNMHIKKYPFLKEEIETIYQLVYDKKVLPSMRMAQFSGRPVEINPTRGYNCSYIPINDFRSFSEIMFLLLSGVGCGFSVQIHHIEELPEIKHPLKRKRRYLVSDNIQGWADAVKVLLKAYFFNQSDPIFDYSDIREKGAALVTSGGKAPGAQPLKDCLHNLRKVLDVVPAGEKLTPIQAHDMVCYIADSVLSGGIRRSATISLFSVSDQEMLTCKNGNWWEKNPQRARANNSAVILRHRIRKKEFLELWERIKLGKSGEPGIFFTNDKEIGSNPCCVSGDTWVITSEGPRKVKDIVNKKVKIIANGSIFKTTNSGFWETGIKDVYEIRTKKGFEVKVTSEHKILTPLGWRRLNELKIDDEINLSNNVELQNWPGNGNFKEGWLIGSLIGDGTFLKGRGNRNDSASLEYWQPTGKFMAEIAFKYLTENVQHRRDLSIVENLSNKNFTITSVGMASLAKRFGVYHKNKIVTDEMEKGSSDFYRGVLRGLFDADGSVQGNQIKGISIRLAQSNLNLLKRCQRMMSRLGIISKIYGPRNKAGYRKLPDGKGGGKYYYCKDTYELVVTKNNVRLFFDIIGFNEPEKYNKLKNKINSYKRNLNRENFLDKIVAIEKIGKERVYDVEVEKVHEFDANGFRVHNCEASLKGTRTGGQFCNLDDVNISDVQTQEELNKRAKAASFIGTLQAGYTDFHYLRDGWKKLTEKDALLGVGMTGIARDDINKLDFSEAAEIVKQENERVAKLIGINKASRLTVVKPSGTTSLVLGTSSGIHAWHSKYYIRRIRIMKNEPIYRYLKKEIPELIEDDFEKPHLGAVISIPVKAPENAILRENETTLELLERVKFIQETWISSGHRKGSNKHNVSCTLSVKGHEWDEVGEWMWKNRDSYNGLAVLPYFGGTYVQMPHEEIDEEKYNELFSYLKKIDLKKIKEEDDNTAQTLELACSGGSCEIV